MRFHHVGHATRSLERTRPTLQALGYRLDRPVLLDADLGVHVEFWSAPTSPTIELLAPGAPDSPLLPILRQRSGPYHYAFLADSPEETNNWATKVRARALTPELRAVSFPESRIRFFGIPDGSVFEIIWPMVYMDG